EGSYMRRQTFEAGVADLEEATSLIDRLDQSDGWGPPLRCNLGGHKQLDAGATGRSEPDSPSDIRSQVLRRRLPRSETKSIDQPWLDAIDAKRAPILTVRVPGNQIPAASGIDESMRFHGAGARRAGIVPIAEAERFLIATGGRDRGERTSADRRLGAGH